MAEKRKWRMTRRGFLIGIGATTGALAVGVALGREPFYRMLASNPAESDPPPGAAPLNTADAWFEITPDDRVRVFMAKIELGQGVHTSLAQIAADELDARWDQIEIVQATTSNGPGDGLGTQASASITGSWLPLRQAAASMREMLKLTMAAQIGVDVASLTASDGVVMVADDPDTRMTYGELVAATSEWPAPPEDPPLRERSAYKMIGQSMPRVDLPAKIRGEAEYAFDMRIDGMLYGAVAHPPHIGAEIVSASAGTAKDSASVVDVVIDVENNFAGVVAKTRPAAWRAVEELAITWSDPIALDNAAIMEQLDASGAGMQMQIVGNAPQEIGDAPTHEAEYTSGMAVHATMSPQAALADVRADGATIWSGMQWPDPVRTEVAGALGLDQENVEIVPTYVGGGFGRKLIVESAIEAARLSQAVGKPVHVGWNRQSSMQQGMYRPPTRNRIRAKMDGDQIAALDVIHSSGETLFPLFPLSVRLLLGVDSGSYTGAASQYERIPNRQMTANIVKLPIRTGLWRGLGLTSNTFANESFLDELAASVSADPLQFRLNHLDDSPLNQRMRGVLEATAESANWNTPAPDGRARGIAVCADTGTCMAMVAEVSIDNEGVRVHHVHAAVDAGLIINPDGARAQIQGNVMMGVSSALLETIDVQDGAVQQANFHNYPILKLDRAPAVTITLIESDSEPRGLGEYVVGPVAAAIGNALFALTGERQRSLPLQA